MFSSNPFPELPSSPNVSLPPNFYFDQQKDYVFFNYHHVNTDPFINTLTPLPFMEDLSTTINQDFLCELPQFSNEQRLQLNYEEDENLLQSVISCSKSKKKTEASKKDGHSKINTARGPRDRRVRLSIEISRKFFCLQDFLGFDKASKTLDWLFNKSKKAIKELVEETNHSLSSTVTDQSKLNFLEAMTGESDEYKGKKMKSVIKFGDVKRKKMTPKSKAVFQENFARDQSRAMARARARERTREKMNIKKLDDDLKTFVNDDFAYHNPERNAGENNRAILTASSSHDLWEVLNGGQD